MTVIIAHIRLTPGLRWAMARGEDQKAEIKEEKRESAMGSWISRRTIC
jgi:hypothetical protein